MLPSHLSHERGHRLLMEHIGLQPILQMDMRLGEGTGAVMAFPIVEAAVKLMNEMATFESAGVSEK
jgi:nicotinate-nucleotide--dimethylbenzimidazole phosphoribosyltransferase